MKTVEDEIVNSVVTKFIEQNPRFQVLGFTYINGSHFVQIQVRDETTGKTFWCGEQYQL